MAANIQNKRPWVASSLYRLFREPDFADRAAAVFFMVSQTKLELTARLA
jgi:hypothetical protein